MRTYLLEQDYIKNDIQNIKVSMAYLDMRCRLFFVEREMIKIGENKQQFIVEFQLKTKLVKVIL